VSWRVLFWPRRLAAQIAACVILALFVSQILTASLAVFLAPRHAPPPSPLDVVDRVALILSVLDALPASDRSRVAAALPEGDIHVRLGDTTGSESTSKSPEATPFRRDLETRLGNRRRLQVTATEAPGPAHGILVRARLGDGTPVRLDIAMPRPPNIVAFGIGGFLFYVPFLTVALIFLTLWATRRVTAPLRAFSEAAERLGNERSAPPLPAQGPAELQRAARSFNKMQEQVQRFIADRTRTLAAISHDLRTPITRLRLRVETAVEAVEEQRKMLRDLDQMDAMISSALSFLRDGARDEPIVAVDLASLLQSACDEFSDTGHDVRYVGVANLPARCRPGLVARAVTNLLENAIKYAATTTVDLARDSSGNAIITIDDDGPGIPDAEKDKVFDPFYRLDRARCRSRRLRPRSLDRPDDRRASRRANRLGEPRPKRAAGRGETADMQQQARPGVMTAALSTRGYAALPGLLTRCASAAFLRLPGRGTLLPDLTLAKTAVQSLVATMRAVTLLNI
jgi:signal transduction histidine kinase